MSQGLDGSLDRRGFLAAAGAGAQALGAHRPAHGARAARKSPPNLVLITAGVLGYGELSGSIAVAMAS